jgi:hypothetical protein
MLKPEEHWHAPHLYIAVPVPPALMRIEFWNILYSDLLNYMVGLPPRLLMGARQDPCSSQCYTGYVTCS